MLADNKSNLKKYGKDYGPDGDGVQISDRVYNYQGKREYVKTKVYI